MFDTVATFTPYQQATLALQQAAVTAAYLRAGVALLVGLLQAGVVGFGVRYMARMSDRREQQHAERHEEVMRVEANRHTETMEALHQQGDALRTLIERTAPPRHSG